MTYYIMVLDSHTEETHYVHDQMNFLTSSSLVITVVKVYFILLIIVKL